MSRFRNPKALAVIAIAVMTVVLVAAWYFQPWRLFTNVSVTESIPTASALNQADAAPPKASAEATADEATEDSAQEALPTFPLVLAAGSLISHEYATTGTVRILELESGERFLRIEGLDTSDGPDLEVWITDAPVIEGLDGWRVFDDGNYLSLGPLKGNMGDQNYEIPEGVDLSDFSSVSIWCVRFSVSFGAAELNGI